MRLFLARVDVPPGANLPVHGVDYHKGIVGECGRQHEFVTRGCRPIVYSEEWVKNDTSSTVYVELTTMDSQTDLLLSAVI